MDEAPRRPLCGSGRHRAGRRRRRALPLAQPPAGAFRLFPHRAFRAGAGRKRGLCGAAAGGPGRCGRGAAHRRARRGGYAVEPGLRFGEPGLVESALRRAGRARGMLPEPAPDGSEVGCGGQLFVSFRRGRHFFRPCPARLRAAGRPPPGLAFPPLARAGRGGRPAGQLRARRPSAGRASAPLPRGGGEFQRRGRDFHPQRPGWTLGEAAERRCMCRVCGSGIRRFLSALCR